MKEYTNQLWPKLGVVSNFYTCSCAHAPHPHVGYIDPIFNGVALKFYSYSWTLQIDLVVASKIWKYVLFTSMYNPILTKR